MRGVGLALAVLVPSVAQAAEVIDLAGAWGFRLDPGDQGVEEGWAGGPLPDRINLPGSTEEQGYGTRTIGAAVGRLTRVCEYVGPAWYQREVVVPEAWRGKRVTLLLERCHWETRVLVDGREAGTQNSLSAPHVYDLTPFLTPGDRRLTVRVDNRVKIDIGGWGHSVTDETQTNWNGIIGRIELRATDPVWVASAQVYPDLARKAALVRVRIGNAAGQAADTTVVAEARLVERARGGHRQQGTVLVPPTRDGTVPNGSTTVELEVPLGGGLRTWDEFTPALYEVRVGLSGQVAGRPFSDEAQVWMGMRELGRQGTKLTVNGRPIFLRGTLECCIFPLTGYPPTDVPSWRRVFRVAKSYGLNHLRFHSWCPPEAAFTAADELGFMLQVELPLWVGERIDADPARAEFERAEAERILEAYGNHPSFCLLSMGNELLMGGSESSFLQGLVEQCRESDPRRLYTCSTHPYDTARNDDYFVSAHGPGGALRGHGRLNSQRPTTDFDWTPAIAGLDRPTIAHELGQWAMYANLREVRKYTGALQARNFEAYGQSLRQHGMLDQAEAFRRASGAFMVALYREEIETALRTPGLAGFQLLDVHDFPGQGTAIVGMLDPFWDSKGLISPEEFRRYCSPTVPLLRLPKRVWTSDETLTARAEVAHYGAQAIGQAEARWSVRDERGGLVAEGRLGPRDVATGAVTALGEFSLGLGRLRAPGPGGRRDAQVAPYEGSGAQPKMARAQQYAVGLALEGTEARNEWDVWVYPAAMGHLATGDSLRSAQTAGGAGQSQTAVRVAREWGQATREALAEGKAVVLLPRTEWLANTVPGSFTPVFWCTRLFPGQPGTMGILCDPKHPALAQFPTASHNDWQWWDALTRSRALILDQTPPPYRPLVQVIDNFDRNHKLGVVFEARVGPGKLLVSTIDLESDLAQRPAARQLRESLLSYARSDLFQPTQELTVSVLDRVLEPSPIRKMAVAPTADDLARAALNAKAAVNISRNQAFDWRPEHDEVIARQEGFGYGIEGGTWIDETGSAWHGASLGVTITCPKGFVGTLFAHFHDWNSLGRTGVVSFEGEELGPLGDHAGPGLWLAIPVGQQDSADGRLELEAQVMSGPNLMITQAVLVAMG